MENPPQWEQIATMTHAILAAARADDWDAVARIEPLRRGLMEAFFARKVAVEDIDAVAQGIREVMAADREVMALCEQAKDSVGLQLGQLSQGRKAQAAYQQNR